MTTKTKDITPLEELKGLRKNLQEAGVTLLHAASNAVGAVAKNTLTATDAIIGAAEEALGAAKEKLRKASAEMHKKA